MSRFRVTRHDGKPIGTVLAGREVSLRLEVLDQSGKPDAAFSGQLAARCSGQFADTLTPALTAGSLPVWNVTFSTPQAGVELWLSDGDQIGTSEPFDVIDPAEAGVAVLA